MRISQIDPDLRPLMLPAEEVPHLTIEPNKTCNIRCAACYSLDRQVVKPLQQVKDEIDLGMRRRNLESISLLGGEPTLHPGIVQIVRHVKRRGLLCMLLTNGVTLLGGDGDRLLDELVAAGVDRFILHVDEGQAHVHGDVAAVRHELCRRLERRRAWFALAVTLQGGAEDALSGAIREHAQYRFFDGVLATLALDFEGLFADRPQRFDPAELARAHTGLREELGVRPASVIRTSEDDDEVGWLMYFYYLNTRTQRTFSLSPRFNRSLRWLWRALTGRQFFAATTDPRAFLPCLLATVVIELLLAPRRVLEVWQLLRASALGRALRFQYVVIQVPPHIDAQGRLHLCRHCPDAVVRHGELLPVCIADQLDPLGAQPARAPDQVVREVRRHLGGERREPAWRKTG